MAHAASNTNTPGLPPLLHPVPNNNNNNNSTIPAATPATANPPKVPLPELPPTDLVWPRFRRSISWRLACVCLLGVLLGVTLRVFQNKGNLTTAEKRGFNALTILFSALTSVTLGSLLGFLGGMLRWRLLAVREHLPVDVDFLLGMQNPTGSLQLVWAHVWGRRWSRITLAVAAYFLVNMVGRLGIATLGLAYSLNEMPGIQYPVLVTNWSSPGWFSGPTDASVIDSFRRSGEWPSESDVGAMPSVQVGRWMDLAMSGLSVLNEGRFNYTIGTTYNASDIGSSGLDREISQDGTVSYSYHFREFQGDENRTMGDSSVLRSVSKCTARIIRDDAVYEGEYGRGGKGRMVANFSGVPQGITEKEIIPADVPLLARVSMAVCGEFIGNSSREQGVMSAVWLSVNLGGSAIPDPPECATTYFFSNPMRGVMEMLPLPDNDEAAQLLECRGVLYECSTCAGEESSKPNTGGPPELFPGLPPGMSPFYSRQLARFPTQHQFFGRAVQSGNTAGSWVMEVMNFRSFAIMDETATELIQGFTVDLNEKSVGLSDIYYVTKESEIMAAEIAARPPVLALLEAQKTVPRMAKYEGDSELPYVIVALEVKWDRVFGIFFGILAGLALAVGMTLLWCRRIVMRDQSSFLSIAMLLRRPLEATGGRTVDAVDDLARQMRDEGIRMRYGARRKTEKSGHVYELALWKDSEGKFYDGKYQ